MSGTGKESWRNTSGGYIFVNTVDRRGDIVPVSVIAGNVLQISPADRAMNEESAADPSLNVFGNGQMVPVRLIDGTSAEDKAAIEGNPNLKSEDDLRKMFGLQWKKFETEVGEIGNVVTLNRLKTIAQEGDATVRQVNVIEARIAEIDPAASVPDVTMQSYGTGVPSLKEQRTPKAL